MEVSRRVCQVEAILKWEKLKKQYDVLADVSYSI